jgi:hypothetical protein
MDTHSLVMHTDDLGGAYNDRIAVNLGQIT